jgi:hypothetical protein
MDVFGFELYYSSPCPLKEGDMHSELRNRAIINTYHYLSELNRLRRSLWTGGGIKGGGIWLAEK